MVVNATVRAVPASAGATAPKPITFPLITESSFADALMPPLDSDLKLEREEVDGWVRSFVGWTLKAMAYESLKPFGHWARGISPQGRSVSISSPESAALVVLSHQEGDKLFFDGTNKVPAVYSSDLARVFGPTSVAILSACNAADPGSFDILQELNANGVGAIIASPTLLITPVGGRFLKTLFAELASPETNLQRARFLVTRKLMHDPDVGPQGLSFTFLWNPNASVCTPRAPAPLPEGRIWGRCANPQS